jgi:hypothetical protein
MAVSQQITIMSGFYLVTAELSRYQMNMAMENRLPWAFFLVNPYYNL